MVFHCILQEAESFYLALKHGSFQISHFLISKEDKKI